MAKDHDLEVEGGNVYPEELHVQAGDRISWNPGKPSTEVEIDFDFNGLGKTPVEWKYKKENPGVPVKGKVKNSVAIGRYPYRVGNSTLEPGTPFASGPEIIVDGGLQPKRRQTTRTKTTRTKRAAPVKRTKKAPTRAATKRAKATTRAGSTKRAKTKSAKTTRRAKSTKRAKTKRAKR